MKKCPDLRKKLGLGQINISLPTFNLKTMLNIEDLYNLYTPGCICTFTGLKMDVFNPKPEMICIEDIAHALSQIPRFGGHLPRFYSVAQHAFECSLIADPEDAFEALMHDGSEAYLLDMPAPIKQKMPEYQKIEHQLMQVIAKRFNFTYPKSLAVGKIDKQILEMEWRKIMLKEPLSNGFPFVTLTPATAKEMFLCRFEELKPKN